MNDIFYFLDNNVVSHLSAGQIESDFFSTYCRVPNEVLYEAAERQELRPALYPTSVAVLDAVRDIMDSLEPGDITLVNLYANTGNADPFLVACALVETRKADLLLVKPIWKVVSNDRAVREKARDFGVVAIDRDEFFEATYSDWGRTW